VFLSVGVLEQGTAREQNKRRQRHETAVGFGVMAAALMLAAGACAASASTLRVPTEFATVQSAVDAAVAGDTVLIAPGIYNEAVRIEGKSIVLAGDIGPGESPGAVVLDGFGLNASVLTIADASGAGVEIRGLEIRNGLGTRVDSACWEFGEPRFGGGVRVVSSVAGLRNVRLTQNNATLGGGLFYESGSVVTIDDSEFSGNTAGEVGAAIAGCWEGAPGSLVMRGSTVRFNSLFDGAGRYGIVALGAGPAVISGTTFEQNSQTLMVLASPPRGRWPITVSGSIFRNNERLFGSVYFTLQDAAAQCSVTASVFENEGLLVDGRGGVFIAGRNGAAVTVAGSTFRAVSTNAVEGVLFTGSSMSVENITTDQMPDGSVFGFADEGSSVTVRDVRASGGQTGVGLVGSNGSRLRADRITLSNMVWSGLTVTLSSSATARLSNVLISAVERVALDVIAPNQPEEGVATVEAEVVNATLAGNGIGLRMLLANEGRFRVANTIIAENRDADYLPPLEPSTAELRYNIINGGIYPGVAVRDVPPGFVAPLGGDYRLGPDSPAIDAGDSGALQVTELLDAAGLLRRIDAPAADTGVGPGAVVDIGALEFIEGGSGGGGGTACNAADIANTDGLTIAEGGGPDGAVDNGDFQAFFALFFAGCQTP